MIPIFAPKLAAFEIPNVEGEASSFFKTFCINKPLKDKDAPTTTAPKVLGSLILYIMFIYSLSPIPNKAFKESEKEILLDPMHKETINKINNVETKKIKLIIVFLLFLFISISTLFISFFTM